MAHLNWLGRRGPGTAEGDWLAAARGILGPRIRERAFYLWEERVRTGAGGSSETDWLRAEQLEMLATMG